MGRADDSRLEASRSTVVGGDRAFLCREPFRVRGWRYGSETFEVHSGVPNVLPKHFHDTYQIAYTTRRPGNYVCDGKAWWAPPGSVIVFHPGEVHSTEGACVRQCHEASRLIYVEASRMEGVLDSIARRSAGPPVFDSRVILHDAFIRHFSAVHALSGSHAPRLETESLLLSLLVGLVAGYASGNRLERSAEHNRRKALRVRDYIQAHYRDNISLADLAAVAHTSPYHLNRLFSKAFGMPPHAFQTQVRIEHAKSLLLRGGSVAQAAATTGFYDQSHLARYFKRIVGVSPRAYVQA